MACRSCFPILPVHLDKLIRENDKLGKTSVKRSMIMTPMEIKLDWN